MPNLEKYSKADLIWIINRLCTRGSIREHDIFCAIRDLWVHKEMQRIEAADRYADLAFKKQQEYIELMKPYDGKLIKDIPKDVLNRAYQLADDIRRANSMWMKMR